MRFFPPIHSPESVLREIADGVDAGTVTLGSDEPTAERMAAELSDVVGRLNDHIARHFPDAAPIELPPAAVMEEVGQTHPGVVSEYLWAMTFLLDSLNAAESRNGAVSREAKAFLQFTNTGFPTLASNH